MNPNDPSGGGGNPFGGMGGMPGGMQFSFNGMPGGGGGMDIDPSEIFKMFMGQ